MSGTLGTPRCSARQQGQPVNSARATTLDVIMSCHREREAWLGQPGIARNAASPPRAIKRDSGRCQPVHSWQQLQDRVARRLLLSACAQAGAGPSLRQGGSRGPRTDAGRGSQNGP